MEVRLKPGAWVDPAKMVDTIRRAGYTPMLEDIRMTLTGKLTGDPAQPAVRVEDVKTPVTLTLVADEKSPSSFTTAVELLRQGKEIPVEIEGRWRASEKPGAASGGTLAVTRVTVMGAGPP
jgi:hypothetical protein